MKYLKEKLIFGWENHNQVSINQETAAGFYDARECETEDIGEELYK